MKSATDPAIGSGIAWVEATFVPRGYVPRPVTGPCVAPPIPADVNGNQDGDDWIDTYINAASAHGIDSEPDHEVGDLQAVLLACWSVMTPAQRQQISTREEFTDVIEDWG